MKTNFLSENRLPQRYDLKLLKATVYLLTQKRKIFLSEADSLPIRIYKLLSRLIGQLRRSLFSQLIGFLRVAY